MYEEENYVSGVHITLYCIFQAILAAIYFAIKLLIYEDDDVENDYHYIDNVIDEWEDNNKLKTFFTAKNILLITIFGYQMSSIRTNLHLLRDNRKNENLNKFLYCIHVVCMLITFVDALAGFVVMCIKWPLIVTALYMEAVAIFVGCALACSFCITVPVIFLFTWLVLFVFRAAVCFQDTSKPVGKFAVNLGSGVVYMLSVVPLHFVFVCIQAQMLLFFVPIIGWCYI